MKVLVDTNIVLDLLTDRLPFSKAARKIFATAEQWKMDLFITASSVTDIFYIVRKHTDRKKAEEILVQLLDIVKIIEVTGKDIKKALTLDFNDFEDALQARCAKKRKLDFIITRNKKDFAKSSIKAISPDELLKKLA